MSKGVPAGRKGCLVAPVERRTVNASQAINLRNIKPGITSAVYTVILLSRTPAFFCTQCGKTEEVPVGVTGGEWGQWRTCDECTEREGPVNKSGRYCRMCGTFFEVNVCLTPGSPLLVSGGPSSWSGWASCPPCKVVWRNITKQARADAAVRVRMVTAHLTIRGRNLLKKHNGDEKAEEVF